MAKMNILYISLEGNTRSFVKRLTAFAKQQNMINQANPEINAKEIGPQDAPASESKPFFVFVPTYLTGGNGIDSGYTEIMTTALGEYIEDGNNARYCIGVVGSGNKNFNEQYCLTARKYAKIFNAPFLDNYELRGTDADVERIYGKPFSYVDITKEYDNLVANDEIRKKKVNARDLEDEISKLQQESGYPYIINIDTVNRANPIDGKIVMSNLCSEIAQVQVPSKVADDQSYETLGTDISCNLGSTNIANMMDSPDFGRSVRAMMRGLTHISDVENLTVVPSIKRGNALAHSVGLGAMGLHSYLAKNHIQYGSPVAIEFTGVYFMLLNYWSLVASNEIAKERQETFHNFDKSSYADGSYFDKYTTKDWGPQSDVVKDLFHGIFIPGPADWAALKEKVMQDGLYNEYRLAVAPNGSTSYINDSTASLTPIINRVEERQEKMIGKIYYPAPYLSNDTMPYYRSAYDIDMRKVIDTYAAAQQHVDQSMSLTLFMRSTIPEGLYEWKNGRTNKMTTRDLNILRHYA